MTDLNPDSTRLDRLFDALAWLVLRRPGLIVWVALLCMVGALWPARQLTVVEQESLFWASGERSIEERTRLDTQLGGSDFLVGIVEGGAYAARQRFVDAWVQALDVERNSRLAVGQDPLLRYSYYRLPMRFFEDRRLLYLKQVDLLDIEQRLTRRLEQERLKNNPFYFNLEDEEEPEVDIAFEDLQHKYGVQRFHEYLSSADGSVFAALFKPEYPVYQRQKALETLRMIRQAGRDLLARSEFKDVSFLLGGTYFERIAQTQKLDRALTGYAAMIFLGVSLIVLLVFRRIRPLWLLWLSVSGGVLLLLGLAGAGFGALSTMGALSLPLALAFGLAYGIQMLYSYVNARSRNLDINDALSDAMRQDGRPAILSAFVTACGMFALAGVDLLDFRQFGLLGGAGVLIMATMMTTVLPAVLALTERRRLMVISTAVRLIQPLPRRMARGRAVLAIGFIGAALGALILLQSFSCLREPWCSALMRCCPDTPCCDPFLDRDLDFSEIRTRLPAAREVREKISRISPLSQDPLTIVAPSREVLLQVVQRIEASKAEPDSVIQTKSSIFTFLPTEQEEKRAILRRIDALATEENIGFLDSRVRRRIDDVRPILHPPQVGLYQLPRSVIQIFSLQPKGSEALLDVLQRALAQQAPGLSPELREQVLRQTLDRMPDERVKQILDGLSEDDRLAAVTRNVRSRDPREALYRAIREFDEHYVGCVAFVYPSHDGYFAPVAKRLEEQSVVWVGDQRDISVTGSALDLAVMIRRVSESGPLLMLLAFLVAGTVFVVTLRRSRHIPLVLIVQVVAAFWLVLGMAGLGTSWNIYSYMAIPVVVGVGFDTALRMWLRYWQVGQIGALQAVTLTAPSVALMVLSLVLNLSGWALVDAKGVAIIGQVAILGTLIGSLAGLTLLPALLEQVQARRARLDKV